MINSDNIIFHHQLPAQLRFSDVDAFGHVNNSIYFQLFDMGKTQYFMDVVREDIFKHFGIVVVHVEGNFVSPIYYPDEIAIETSIVHLGNKSFTLMQRAINSRTKEVKCECETTMVTVDLDNNVAIRVPDEFREHILAYEDSEVLV